MLKFSVNYKAANLSLWNYRGIALSATSLVVKLNYYILAINRSSEFRLNELNVVIIRI